MIIIIVLHTVPSVVPTIPIVYPYLYVYAPPIPIVVYIPRHVQSFSNIDAGPYD